MLILSQNGGLKTDFAVICRAVVKASVSGQPPVQPGVVDAKMKTVFAFGVEGSAGDTPCPHASALRLRGTGKAAETLPGTPELSHNLVPVCYPALAFLTVKNTEKVNPDLLFALRNACRGIRKKAVMRPPSRCQSVVKGSVRRYRRQCRQCQMKLRLSWSG